MFRTPGDILHLSGQEDMQFLTTSKSCLPYLPRQRLGSTIRSSGPGILPSRPGWFLIRALFVPDSVSRFRPLNSALGDDKIQNLQIKGGQ